MPRLIDMIGYENEYLKVVGKRLKKYMTAERKFFNGNVFAKIVVNILA